MVDWHARYIQQATWTRKLRAYLFDRTGARTAERILEVGCGTGAVLADLEVGGSVHGLDLQAASLTEAARHAPRIRLTCGDALRLPYAKQSFGITFCHFLLLWVPDPLQALREMKRVTRPSGHLLALAEPDYSTRQDAPLELAVLGRWQSEALKQQGANPSLGSRLADYFYRAGIQLLETGTIAPSESDPSSPVDWELEWKVLEFDLAGLIPDADLQRLKALDRQARARGERTLHVPTYFAWGQV